MGLNHQAIDWQIGIHDNYMPVYYKGAIAGFLRTDYADRIISHLHAETTLNQALTKACTDLLRQTGGDLSQVERVVGEYIQGCLHPQSQNQGIIGLLQQRQTELNLSDKDFALFCETFKLSRVDLGNIYAGEYIDDCLLVALAKILAISQQELAQLRDGK